MKQLSKCTLVWVKWLDHFTTGGGWVDENTAYNIGDLHCETVGFLVRETKNYIKLCLNRDITGDKYSDFMTIHKKCIVDRRELRPYAKKSS